MRALDLYCGGGGAGRGLLDAGLDVTGVDVEDRPRYPGQFLRADVLSLDPEWIATFDFVWSSPPCQTHSRLTKGTWGHRGGGGHLDLIPETRELLVAAGVPFVMENTEGVTTLRRDVLLCGQMFGLPLVRHRLLEVHGFDLVAPEHPEHRGRVFYVTGHSGGSSRRDAHLGHRGSAAEWREAMGIDWLPQAELVQAVPPAYSRWTAEGWLEARVG